MAGQGRSHGWAWEGIGQPLGPAIQNKLLVEKLTFNSLAKALVDIPVVSMPIARSLKT
jgi:hypothetical protein